MPETSSSQALSLSETALRQAAKAANDGLFKIANINAQVGIGWALYAHALSTLGR